MITWLPSCVYVKIFKGITSYFPEEFGTLEIPVFSEILDLICIIGNIGNCLTLPVLKML